MRVILFLVVLVLAATLQHTMLAHRESWPDLMIALLAWVLVRAAKEHLLWQAWLVGIVHDTVDPASSVGHSIFALLSALIAIRVRLFLFHSEAMSAFLLASILVVLHGVIWAGYDHIGSGLVLDAAITGVTAGFWCWMSEGFGRSLHPLGMRQA